jgi:FkbM family methyltransferase
MSDRPLRRQLDELLAAPSGVPEPIAQGPVVLYGAGGKGRETLAILRNEGCEVAAIIDRTAVGQIDGIAIRKPDDPAIAALARADCPVIVTVFNPGADPLPIHDSLLALGFRQIIGMVEARQRAAANDAYWLSTAAAMTPPSETAVWLFDRLADDLSRHTLLEAISLRASWSPRLLRSPTPRDQYLPAGVPLRRAEVRFVDGGAFDGDTILSLVAAGFTFEAIAAFEPDPKNYATLTGRLAAARPCDELSVWPCGLDEMPQQVLFRADGLASSGIAADGNLLIQTVALDSALPMFRPTYVKLDIEGAESAALQGMAKTIRSSRPALAVCVYHKPADLWEIPMLVDDLLPDSDFYLRAHAWNGFDLVFYAEPREMTRA